MDNREIRVYERRSKGDSVEWKENHDLRESVDVPGADALLTHCISVAANVEYRYRQDASLSAVTAFKITAAYFINLPGGGSAGAQIEVFRELKQ